MQIEGYFLHLYNFLRVDSLRCSVPLDCGLRRRRFNSGTKDAFQSLRALFRFLFKGKIIEKVSDIDIKKE